MIFRKFIPWSVVFISVSSVSFSSSMKSVCCVCNPIFGLYSSMCSLLGFASITVTWGHLEYGDDRDWFCRFIELGYVNMFFTNKSDTSVGQPSLITIALNVLCPLEITWLIKLCECLVDCQGMLVLWKYSNQGHSRNSLALPSQCNLRFPSVVVWVSQSCFCWYLVKK